MKINKTNLKESVKLEEKFSESMPAWLKAAYSQATLLGYGLKRREPRTKDPNQKLRDLNTNIVKDYTSHSGRADKYYNLPEIMFEYGIDPSTANFISIDIPKKGTDPIFKDPNRVFFFHVKYGDAEQVYVKDPRGLGNTLISIIPNPNKYRSDQYQYLSYPALREYVIDLCYVDVDPAQIQAVKDRDVERTQHGQEKILGRGLGTERVPAEHQISWNGPYDKSGYRVDPKKYEKKLKEVGFTRYASKIQKIRDEIVDLRDKILDALEEADPFDPDFGNIAEIVDSSLRDTITEYSGITQRIKDAEELNNVDSDLFKQQIRDIMGDESWQPYGRLVNKLRKCKKAADTYLPEIADWEDEYDDMDQFWK